MNNMPSYSLQCTALMGVNKAGVLKPNADGYYEVILGGLDCFNSGGSFYDYLTSKQKFEDSGILQGRVKSGKLRGELGHPKRQPGQSKRDYENRILQVYEERTCFQIMKLWLVPGGLTDKTGRKLVAIMGLIIPSGELGHVLKAQLDNPNENVCFSLRSFTIDRMVRGTNVKTLDQIITWDSVNDPGIAQATKYDCPSLEEQSFSFITEDSLLALSDDVSGLGLESDTAQIVNQMLLTVRGNSFELSPMNLSRW